MLNLPPELLAKDIYGVGPYEGKWAALERSNMDELTEADAPGYRRAPICEWGALWPEVTAPDGWGFVHFLSIWTEKTGGDCVHRVPFQAEWALRRND